MSLYNIRALFLNEIIQTINFNIQIRIARKMNWIWKDAKFGRENLYQIMKMI